jgi:hypothetical protein
VVAQPSRLWRTAFRQARRPPLELAAHPAPP